MSSSFIATRRLLAPHKGPVGPQSVAEALRRNELSRRQAKRRKETEDRKYRHDYERDRLKETKSLLKLKSEQVKQARKIRKEDYELGPLAPRRDVGELEHTYGTANPRLTQTVDRPRWKRKWCPFKVGDRVVLLEGRDKGQIGIIDDIDDTSQHVKVRDLNMIDVLVPGWFDRNAGQTGRVRPHATFLPFESMRLVFPLPHPVTGEEREVIIENLERRVDWYDETTNITHYKRVVPELDDYEIPWPSNEEPIYTDYEDDTLRISTEHVTFEGQALPLMSPPMPHSVIDELRNKHSKLSLRRIKDPEYLAKLRGREEDTERRNLEMMAAMRTPLQELHALRASQKAQRTEDSDVQKVNTTYLDIREGKPWTRKVTYDAKKEWKRQWEAEKKAATEEGRKAKRPSKNPRKQEPFDESFLEQLGAMMQDKGLDGSKKASSERATA